MATTSGTLVEGKAVAGRGGNGHNGRYSLQAKVLAGAAALGCAAALAFGGLQIADRPTSRVQQAAPANVALAQTLAGAGYLEFSPGESPVIATPASGAPSIARARSLAGAGLLEFQPGEGPIVTTRAGSAAVGTELREYLDGESPTAALPLSAPATQPAPLFGPQP